MLLKFLSWPLIQQSEIEGYTGTGMDLHVSVQDGATLYTRVLYLTVLSLSIVSSQRCTTAILDPQNVRNYDPSKLVPLRGQETVARYPFLEQWIFPDLQFTCYGLVTKWIFAGVPGQGAAPCTVEIETWRLDTTPGLIDIVYDRISTTERSIVTITQDGPIFTYDLASPVLVEPGDTVGVVLEYLCIESEGYDNVLSFNISGNGSTYVSYRQAGPESTFFLEPLYSATAEQHLIPLIEAVVEPYPGFTRSIAIETLSATERVTTGPEADQSESGGSLVTTILAAIVGVTIGIITTAIVCVCVWCIIRYVNHNKGQKSVANKQQQYNDQQQDGSTNMISMQQNEAYAEPTVCHIAIGTSELNRVSGVRGERCMGVDAEETGDEYERMHAANDHMVFRPSARGLEIPKCSNFDNPGREYVLPVQQREGNMYTLSEDTERCYEHI